MGRGRLRGSGTTMFYTKVSERWAGSAAEVAGVAGFAIAVILWQTVKLGFPSRGCDPYDDGVVFTYPRVRQHVPMARTTYTRTLRKMAAAGLIEINRPRQGDGNRVRVVPIAGEEKWTERALKWR
jgi:hypothetical protein